MIALCLTVLVAGAFLYVVTRPLPFNLDEEL